MTAEKSRRAPIGEELVDGRGKATYSFGDIETAALRLQLVDRVFAEPSRALLEVARSAHIALAVDLGCGPGFSTALIAEELRPDRLVGLDTSEAFLQRAKAAEPRASWIVHDVTAVPLPTGPADLLHARFVLSHLSEPEAVLVAWLGQLKPGGYLLAQDDEQIVTSVPALVAYEEMARSLVAHGGGDLWVGARLARLIMPSGFRTILSRVYRQRVPVALAAQMFAMNFAVWRHDPFITRTQGASALDRLATELDELANTNDDPSNVVFDIRQLGFQRH
jgi:trans-aconitate methyltransferase